MERATAPSSRHTADSSEAHKEVTTSISLRGDAHVIAGETNDSAFIANLSKGAVQIIL